MRLGMLIDLSICAGCAACVMACKQANGTPKGIYWTTVLTREVGTYPDVKKRCLPKGCMHCDQAPCVRKCPTGASHKAENGAVLIATDICIGCRACMEACPYQARHYTQTAPEHDPYWGFDLALTPFEQKKTVLLHDLGKVGKCNFCLERVQRGSEPMCVQTCITRCRMVGDLDDPQSDISLAIQEQGARPWHEEYQTRPSVYYVGLSG